MKKYTYKLKLKGLSTPQGTIPLRALKELCDILLDASERGLRLAVEAESVKRGKLPAWNSKLKYRPKSGWLKDIWEKWPGDESVDELLAALKHT